MEVVFNLWTPEKVLSTQRVLEPHLENCCTSSFLYILPKWSYLFPWVQCLFLCYVIKRPKSLSISLTLLLNLCPTYIIQKWSKPTCKTQPAPHTHSSSCLIFIIVITQARYLGFLPHLFPFSHPSHPTNSQFLCILLFKRSLNCLLFSTSLPPSYTDLHLLLLTMSKRLITGLPSLRFTPF